MSVSEERMRVKTFQQSNPISQLLCVCDVCKTPFETVHLHYTSKSKVPCRQCGADSVNVIRCKSYQASK